MQFIEVVILILIVLYASYIVFERFLLSYLRKQFKCVIHVNGIRGKSTTTRLIDAGLRGCGLKVFSKTTGTVPTYISVNNEDREVFRLGTPNIREQIKMMYLAKKQGAEYLVLECMAVNPELQEVSERMILKADITVITNVREDHIQEMGRNKDEIAEAFSKTIPTSGHLIVRNDEYIPFFQRCARRKNTKVVVPPEYTGDDLMDTFKDNIEEALSVADILDLDRDTFLDGMRNYHHDMGAFVEIRKNDTLLLNGLSINDPESTIIIYDYVSKKYPKEEITVFLNSRADRPTRVLQHIKMMSRIDCKKLILTGSNIMYVEKMIRRENPDLDIEIMKRIEDLEKEKIIFACGNIKGMGMKVLDYFKKEE